MYLSRLSYFRRPKHSAPLQRNVYSGLPVAAVAEEGGQREQGECPGRRLGNRGGRSGAGKELFERSQIAKVEQAATGVLKSCYCIDFAVTSVLLRYPA